MYNWFFFSVFGSIAVLPLYFLSVERLKLSDKYGKERGDKIGNLYGIISGWVFFISWIGIWVSPQSRFSIRIFQGLSFLVPVFNFQIPVVPLIIFIPFFSVGAWFGIKGVKAVTLKTAETHKAEKVVTSGVYSIVRHPQYLGGLLSHVGISFLLSALLSLLSTPLMIAVVYLISRKEEEELAKEFGKEYEKYKRKVPMLIPRYRNLRW